MIRVAIADDQQLIRAGFRSLLEAEPERKAPYGPAGHGIAGMTERAVLVGGWLTAVPEDRRFVVHAVIPASYGPA